jgi:hypothetical protein
MAKQVTREQAERKKQQAAAFMERIGEDDRADEFDGTELQETIDSAIETLNEAYTPETTREDLAAAVGEALDIRLPPLEMAKKR